MKIKHLKVATLLLAGTLLTSSCVGSFSLFNRLAKWNSNATSSKFLNEVIFIFISPAYPVCCLADALVFNSIEFWSGNNPLAQRVGKTQEVMGQDGLYYAITTLRNGYEIKSPNGDLVRLVYDKKNNSWSTERNGKLTEMFRFNNEGSIQACMPDGRTVRVTPDEAGLFEARMAMHGATFYCMQ